MRPNQKLGIVIGYWGLCTFSFSKTGYCIFGYWGLCTYIFEILIFDYSWVLRLRDEVIKTKAWLRRPFRVAATFTLNVFGFWG